MTPGPTVTTRSGEVVAVTARFKRFYDTLMEDRVRCELCESVCLAHVDRDIEVCYACRTAPSDSGFDL